MKKLLKFTVDKEVGTGSVRAAGTGGGGGSNIFLTSQIKY